MYKQSTLPVTKHNIIINQPGTNKNNYSIPTKPGIFYYILTIIYNYCYYNNCFILFAIEHCSVCRSKIIIRQRAIKLDRYLGARNIIYNT